MINLELSTHSGETDTLEVESFDAEDVADKINNNEKNVIVLGGNVYSRIDIKNIKVVDK